MENAIGIAKLVAFLLILGATWFVGHKVRSWLGFFVDILKSLPVVHRLFGTRNIDTEDHGRVIELTQVSIPDYVLIWIWGLGFMRIYLWGGIDWVASWIDARFQQLPIDPWNKAGAILKSATDAVNTFHLRLEELLAPISWMYYVVAGLLVGYVAWRFLQQCYRFPLRFIITFIFAAALGTAIAYGVGFTLGGAFGAFKRYGFEIETVTVMKPLDAVISFGSAFKDHPLRQSMWVAFIWWCIMGLYCSIWQRLQYVPRTRELRMLDCWGLGGRLLNVVEFASTDSESEGTPTEAKNGRNARTVQLEWRPCGTLESFFLFGGMAFYDSEYVPGRVKPLIVVHGFPRLFFTVVKYNKYNAVLASERLGSATADASSKDPKKGRLRRIFAAMGRAGRRAGTAVGNGVTRLRQRGKKPAAPPAPATPPPAVAESTK